MFRWEKGKRKKEEHLQRTVADLVYRDVAQGNVDTALVFNCLFSSTVSWYIYKENLITSSPNSKNFWPSLCVTVSNKDHGTRKLGRRQRAGRNPSWAASQSQMQLVHPLVQRQRALGLILSNLGVAGKAEWKWLILGQRKRNITALMHCAAPARSTTSLFLMAPSASAVHLHFRKVKLHVHKIDFFN